MEPMTEQALIEAIRDCLKRLDEVYKLLIDTTPGISDPGAYFDMKAQEDYLENRLYELRAELAALRSRNAATILERVSDPEGFWEERGI